MNAQLEKAKVNKKQVEIVQTDFQKVGRKISTLHRKYKNKGSHVEIESDAHFLKRLRMNLGLTRTDAKKLLGLSVSSIKRYETGIISISKTKLDQFLEGYCISHREYLDFKMGKETSFATPEIPQKPKVIENNSLRRSYKKLITREVNAITRLRKIKGISQYEASRLCGWHKSSFGHIEQGRIQLTDIKVKHILSALGLTMKSFKEHTNSKLERDKIENDCIQMIRELEDSKLISVQTILKNF